MLAGFRQGSFFRPSNGTPVYLDSTFREHFFCLQQVQAVALTVHCTSKGRCQHTAWHAQPTHDEEYLQLQDAAGSSVPRVNGALL